MLVICLLAITDWLFTAAATSALCGYVLVIASMPKKEIYNPVIPPSFGVCNPQWQPFVHQKPLNRHFTNPPRRIASSVNTLHGGVMVTIYTAARRRQMALDSTNPVPEHVDSAVRVPNSTVSAAAAAARHFGSERPQIFDCFVYVFGRSGGVLKLIAGTGVAAFVAFRGAVFVRFDCSAPCASNQGRSSNGLVDDGDAGVAAADAHATGQHGPTVGFWIVDFDG